MPTFTHNEALDCSPVLSSIDSIQPEDRLFKIPCGKETSLTVLSANRVEPEVKPGICEESGADNNTDDCTHKAEIDLAERISCAEAATFEPLCIHDSKGTESAPLFCLKEQAVKYKEIQAKQFS